MSDQPNGADVLRDYLQTSIVSASDMRLSAAAKLLAYRIDFEKRETDATTALRFDNGMDCG
jgi:hypothetical protein